MIYDFKLMEYLSISLSIYWYIHLHIYFFSKNQDSELKISPDFAQIQVDNSPNVWDNNFLFSN